MPGDVLEPRILKPFSWLVRGMTTRSFSPPEEPRLELAARLPERLAAPGARVVVGEQVHGCEVATVTSGDLSGTGVREIPGADALVTDEAGVLIGVFTADCAPVALVDPEARRIAVVHAGREGTRLGIVRGAVRRLEEMGSRPENLLAWIAPAVSAAHYEVSEEIAADFRERFGRFPGAVCGPRFRHLALSEINRRELIASGVPEGWIELDSRCTFENPKLFYSYRREGGGTGRMLTFLGILRENGQWETDNEKPTI